MKTIFDIEKYLSNQQVYVRTEIVDENFDVIMYSGKVYEFGAVEVVRVNKNTIITRIDSEQGQIRIIDNDVTDFTYQGLVDSRFIPIRAMVNNYLLKQQSDE